jgi:hypothetical protein
VNNLFATVLQVDAARDLARGDVGDAVTDMAMASMLSGNSNQNPVQNAFTTAAVINMARGDTRDAARDLAVVNEMNLLSSVGGFLGFGAATAVGAGYTQPPPQRSYPSQQPSVFSRPSYLSSEDDESPRPQVKQNPHRYRPSSHITEETTAHNEFLRFSQHVDNPKQKHWEINREGINTKFAMGKTYAQQHEFISAFSMFSACQREYDEHTDFLSSAEKKNLLELKTLLPHVQREKERIENNEYQAKINARLPEIAEALASYNFSQVIFLLNQEFEFCAKITDHLDVADMEYIPAKVFKASVDTLTPFVAAYENSAREEPRKIANAIYMTATRGLKLNSKNDALQKMIAELLHAQWQHLYLRNVDVIVNGVQQIVADSIQQYNCLASCFHPSKFYIDDLNLLRATIEKLIAENLPVNVRPSILLPMFDPELLYNVRRQNRPSSIARTISAKVNELNSLSAEDVQSIRSRLELVLRDRWLNLDRRNIDFLCAGLLSTIRSNLAKRNMFGAFMNSAQYYIADIEGLEFLIAQYLDENMPQDVLVAVPIAQEWPGSLPSAPPAPMVLEADLEQEQKAKLQPQF